jgi:glycogen synthase
MHMDRVRVLLDLADFAQTDDIQRVAQDALTPWHMGVLCGMVAEDAEDVTPDVWSVLDFQASLLPVLLRVIPRVQAALTAESVSALVAVDEIDEVAATAASAA